MTDEESVALRDPGAWLRACLAELSDVGPGWYEGTLAERARFLDSINFLIESLKEVKANLEQVLVDSMDEDEVSVPGLGTVRRVELRRSTWAHDGASERLRDDLAAAVAAQVALDNATGDIDPMKRNVAMATMRAAYEAIPSFSGLKVAGSKRFRIRLDDYRTYSSYYSVQIGEREDG